MNVYFTVDTESSMGGAWRDPALRPVPADRHVFCRIDGQDYGVPLLVRIMARYGFRATYFVETLATRCLGDADTRSVFDFLLRENQDVQLHIHPTYHYYAESLEARKTGTPYSAPSPNDFIGHLPERVQMDLLSEAARYFQIFAGSAPTAFRAGCYAGSLSMLRCLKRLGIRVDSSFNPCYHPSTSFPDHAFTPNAVAEAEGVWEVPVTVARSPLPEGYRGYKFADCTGISVAELRSMLDACAAAGQEHFVLVFHSFSAVKPKDAAYSTIRPNRIVIKRLEQLFGYLASRPERFHVTTMGDLAAAPESLAGRPGKPAVIQLPRLHAAVRKVVQVANGFYWV